MTPELHTPWHAVKWLVGYLLDGGKEVSLPTILPSPTYSYRPPSMAPSIGDEKLGEPASLALRIGLAVRDAISEGMPEKRVRAIVRAATAQVKYDRKCQKFNAAKLSRPDLSNRAPAPPRNGELKKIQQAADDCRQLSDNMQRWEVLT